MKKMIFMLVSAMIMAAACDPQGPATSTYDITVALVKGEAAYAEADITVKMKDLNGGTAYDAKTNESGVASFSLPAGLYEASASFKKTDDGIITVYNGITSNVTVGSGESAFQIALTESKSSQVIIKELYFGGCPKDDGSGVYANDGYVILYNNSETAVDASDICFGFCTPANSGTSNKFLVNGELLYQNAGWLPAGYATWWFDTQVTIEPYSQIVISLFGAIDHTTTYKKSVNLSNADYAMYATDVFTNKKYQVAESIPTTNYLKTYLYGKGNAWALSQNSPAFYIYKNADNEAFSKDVNNYDYTEYQNMLPALKVKTEWVVDAVEVFQSDSDSNNKRIPATVDAGSVLFTSKQGYSVYRNVDKEATEALEGNAEKLVYNYAGGTTDVEGTTDPSGIDAEKSIANGAKIVYLDSNNSGNDFHMRKFASLTGK